MTESYLVKGAKLKWMCGTQTSELDVENKNICLLKVPMATENDCKLGVNIPGFGKCSHTGEPCIPMIAL